MASTRLTGLLRRLHTGLVPALPGAVPTDRQALAAFVAAKDESAFSVLVQRHGPMVLRVCRRVLGHAQDAEDAFQATFLVLARKAAAIGKAESLSSWLHGVAFRTAMRARRDAGRRRARERQTPIPVPTDHVDDLAWRDVQVLLEAEIRRLPERYRAAFVLCHLEGRSRADAAAELGVEENTLSSRLARARDRLRDRLARRGVHLPAVLAAIALSTGESGLAIPTELLATTARAGAQFAARIPVTGVSTFTLQLTNGVMQTMAIAKLKWAAGVLAIGGTLALGTWGLGQGPGGPRSGAGSSDTGGGPAAAKPAAVERTADYAQRQRSLKNLRQIILAMINFHDATGRFPADITDKAGKSLLSWRVELLPYLEQADLYKQFRRDEPWDSEHNLQLLAKMPDVFRVGFEPKGATHTYYQRFAIAGLGDATPAIGEGGIGSGPGGPPPGAGGPGAAAGPPPAVGGPGIPGGGSAPPMLPGLGGPAAAGAAGAGAAGGPAGPGAFGSAPLTPPRLPLRVTEVTDGTSNTLGLVEAGPPVPWSKPADFAYDTTRPLPPLTGPFANVRHVAMLDGSVSAFRPNLEEQTLRRLIEPNDGNILPDFKTLRARFPADSDEDKKALAKLVEENRALVAALEEQLREHAALLGLTGQLAKDVATAEEQRDELQRMLDALKAKNKKLRDEVGLRPGAGVPTRP